MKKLHQGIRKTLLTLRNKWSPSNSIVKSRNSSLVNMGNVLHTSIRLSGNSKIEFKAGCRVRNSSIDLRGNNNLIEFEEGVVFCGTIELFGDGNVFTIGEKTTINGADFIIHNGTKVEIGSQCLFSTKIDVRTTDSHSIMNEDGERINFDKNIIIGNHVWIGRMVSILKGSQIGDGSVVGSMSLVSGTIPNQVIAAGVPARVIKEKITWKE